MRQILCHISLCFIAFLAYGLDPARSQIVIGAALPESGPDTAIGEQARFGIEWALKDLNLDPNKKGVLNQHLSVKWEDDGCDAVKAVKAAKSLLESIQKVRVIVGHPCSGAAIAAASYYDNRGVVFISTFATNPQLTDKGYHYVFRAVGRDDQQANVAAAYIAKHFAGKNIAILHDNGVYGRDLAKLLQQSIHDRGIHEVMLRELEPVKIDSKTKMPRIADYSTIIKEMKDFNVQAIYYAGYSAVAAHFRKQSWEAGIHVTMLAGDGIVTKEYWSIAGPEAAANTLATSTPDTHLSTAAADVVIKMQADREGKVLPQTLHAYAAVQAWAQAVEKARTLEGDQVAKALRTGRFKTVIGQISFNQKGDRSDPETFFAWYTWRNGNYIELDPSNWQHRGLVCRVQAGLNILHNLNLSTDGLAGEQTSRAIRVFAMTRDKRYLENIDGVLAAEIEMTIEKLIGMGVQFSRYSELQSRGLLCRAQAGLNALGYDAGRLDGALGPMTREAHRNFAAFKKLPYPGPIDEKLVAEIEAAVKARAMDVVVNNR